MHTTKHRIVVLGAGYTGMFAAIRLARRTRRMDVAIALVNPSDRFTERLRMHQVAAGQELGDHRIPELLKGTGIEFVQGWATGIDPDARQVTVDGERTLPYDTLVYALGSATDTSLVPGATEHAYTLNDPRTNHQLSLRLAELAASGGRVTVAGGGLTGIEAATEIAESHPGLNVTLVSRSAPGGMMGEKARGYLNRALDRLRITVRAGASVAKVLPAGVELADGEVVASDLVLWTTGVKVPPLAADSGIATDGRGLISVDATLRSTSYPEIHAVGDAAAVRLPWGQIHGTCQSGLPTAQYTADAIALRLRGKQVKPFRFGYFHQPVSLGRKDAVIQFTGADDSPRRFFLSGRAAVAYKDFVSSSPLKTYRFTARGVYLTTFLSKGGRATR
ncbi:FAD-dependent oxidoreductase [Streptomyces sp. A7024]|uniref:FAD-dependent oxidoreductase n=1 Tax=Streptomyces coryli TaxID=1128680 RepID=A0A6G4TWD7_9ACTN|nr:FAD-dependent oxidoreductase [Streptomyces coryli]NGN63357.1 FAD-dependent oxidoreductase [Streptomyces coryli]